MSAGYRQSIFKQIQKLNTYNVTETEHKMKQLPVGLFNVASDYFFLGFDVLLETESVLCCKTEDWNCKLHFSQSFQISEFSRFSRRKSFSTCSFCTCGSVAPDCH